MGMNVEVGDNLEIFKHLLVGLTLSLYCLCGGMLLMAVVSLFKRGAMGSTSDFFQLKRVPPTDQLADKLYAGMTSICCDDSGTQDIAEMLNNLPVYDLWLLERAAGIMSAFGSSSAPRRRISIANIHGVDRQEREEANQARAAPETTKTTHEAQGQRSALARRMSLSMMATPEEVGTAMSVEPAPPGGPCLLGVKDPKCKKEEEVIV